MIKLDMIILKQSVVAWNLKNPIEVGNEILGILHRGQLHIRLGCDIHLCSTRSTQREWERGDEDNGNLVC